MTSRRKTDTTKNEATAVPPTVMESPRMSVEDYDDVTTELTKEEIVSTMNYAKLRNWKGPYDDGLEKRWWVYDDCCGLVCAFITMGLHVFAYWAQWTYIFKPWLGLFSLPHIIYTFLAFMAVASHTRCQFTAPGVVPAACTPPTRPNIQCDDKDEEEQQKSSLAEVNENIEVFEEYIKDEKWWRSSSR